MCVTGLKMSGLFDWFPLVTDEACNTYILMDIDDSEDYNKVKEGVLAKCEITVEVNCTSAW